MKNRNVFFENLCLLRCEGESAILTQMIVTMFGNAFGRVSEEVGWKRPNRGTYNEKKLKAPRWDHS